MSSSVGLDEFSCGTSLAQVYTGSSPSRRSPLGRRPVCSDHGFASNESPSSLPRPRGPQSCPLTPMEPQTNTPLHRNDQSRPVPHLLLIYIIVHDLAAKIALRLRVLHTHTPILLQNRARAFSSRSAQLFRLPSLLKKMANWPSATPTVNGILFTIGGAGRSVRGKYEDSVKPGKLVVSYLACHPHSCFIG